MNLFKKSVLTIVGTFMVAVGLIFMILPGPAIIFIPVGLALLSLEYPVARKALRKFQRFMRASAVKMDAFFSKR
jgi:hypothetical protein